MKHKKLKLAAAVCLTIGFAVSCSACSTTAFTNLSSYFNKVADIMTPDKNTTPSKGEEKEKTPLATPSNFVVNEDSSFSFNGVEGASSYLVYLYDETSKELGNGLITVDDSNYYSGKLTDFVTFGYGRYTAAVVACASIVSDYTDSAAATASYSYGGAISVPRIEYCWEWDSEEGTGSMSFQLANATDYAKQAVPDSVIISITDETTGEKRTESFNKNEINTGSTQNFLDFSDFVAEHSYSAEAYAVSSNESVTNKTTETYTVMKNVTLIKSEDGISSDGYNKQSSGWAPSWGAFNVAVGEAFTFQIAGRITITVTPDDTVQEDDVAYYYTVSDGNAIGGTFKFYESTGKAVLLMNGGPMQNARYTVSWSMNEDGTIRVGRLK